MKLLDLFESKTYITDKNDYGIKLNQRKITSMSWKDVKGYFTYTNLYDIAIKHCPDNSIFVEVGSKHTLIQSELMFLLCVVFVF